MRPSPGCPDEAGLYAACLPMLLYAIVGTSRVLSVSSTSTIAVLVAAELGQVACPYKYSVPVEACRVRKFRSWSQFARETRAHHNR
jgi:MFS superfamily sulfate permease-like transporter